MAQPRAIATPALRVQVVAPERLGATAIAALHARGIEARAVAGDRISVDDELVAWAASAVPGLAAAVALGETCRRAARAGRPVCLLVPAPPASTSVGPGRTDRAELERAAAVAYLAAHGAAIGHDIDAWLESIVFAVRFGAPTGSHVAVIAPTGSWLAAQAIALATEAIGLGQRPPVIAEASDEPTDVALYDPELGAPPATTPSLLVPVIARPELAAAAQVAGPALHTARGALGAATVLGRAAERIAIGLGPAPREASAELAIDRALLDREIGRSLHAEAVRIGDHPTKTLLRAYRVPITKQAVAETPSEAVRKARLINFPVEIKPFGDDVVAETAGAFVEKGVRTDSLVRSAFVNALGSVGRKPDTPGAAVIVRETPQPGRELAVTFLRLPAVGWTVVIEAPGVPVAAAPCPLRVIDAESLARATVVASRAGDPEPDRTGLANLLRRASHLVVDLDTRLVRLVLSRVIVGGRGVHTVVVDAYAELA